MSKGKWAANQPKHGDGVIHCGHADRPCHTWSTDTDFERPDGSTGHADWFMCCDECLQGADGDRQRVEVQGDGTWIGDAPSIEAPS